MNCKIKDYGTVRYFSQQVSPSLVSLNIRYRCRFLHNRLCDLRRHGNSSSDSAMRTSYPTEARIPDKDKTSSVQKVMF